MSLTMDKGLKDYKAEEKKIDSRIAAAETTREAATASSATAAATAAATEKAAAAVATSVAEAEATSTSIGFWHRQQQCQQERQSFHRQMQHRQM